MIRPISENVRHITALVKPITVEMSKIINKKTWPTRNVPFPHTIVDNHGASAQHGSLAAAGRLGANRRGQIAKDQKTEAKVVVAFDTVDTQM